MSRTSAAIVRDIEAFTPLNGLWLPLDSLLAELWHTGEASQWLPVLFAVFERFPKGDGAGVLWSIVHGIEALGIDYEVELRNSLATKTSDMGKIMLTRLNRSKTQ